MKAQNPRQRARDNVRKFVVRAEIQSYEYATLGKPDGTIRAPGVRRVYIVKDNNVATALNEANVPHNARLPLKVRFEHNSWVVKGIDSSASVALASLPDDPHGVPLHPFTVHSDVPSSYTGAGGYVLKVNVTEDGIVFEAGGGGAVDSVNGQTGVVVLDADDIDDTATTNKFATAAELAKLAGIAAGAEVNVNADWNAVTGDAQILNKPTVYNQEEIEDFVGAMVSSNTETGIAVTYDDATGKLNFDAQTAGDARYAPIAKGVTNGDSHDHNGGDGGTIAYSSLSGTPTVYTREEIEDFVGAMLGGTQTGIAVAYVDASGLITFDAQTAGDARYGRLATANSWTQNQTVASTQTTGNALRVIRNLTSTSTDAPVVDLIQDHASDDQAVLRIQQDGAAAIVNIYDTTDLVIQVADGGRLLLTPTATSGAALSVVRDLASASTDWPVVDLIQENSGDDQAVLQLRQDGTGNIITAKDGVNTVFQVQDGGLIVINQVGTTGIGFSVNRNLASASTNNVVAEFVQDNTGDDQAVLRIQQDGTGDILDLYDGATLVLKVADGGIATFFSGLVVDTGGTVNIGNDPLSINTFHIGTTDGASVLTRYVANANGPGFIFQKSRNASVGSHTVVNSGDEIGKFIFRGSDGSAYQTGAQIVVKVDGTPGASDMPGRIEFQVSPDGSVTPAVAVTIKNDKTTIFAGQAQFDDGILLSPGGTQDYSFDDDGANALTLNALSTGKDFDFRIHTQDADGTDNVLISLYAVGKPGSYTNYERGRLIYAAASQEFRFDTGAAGTGTVRPLVLLTGSNTNQIRLATDGTVGFKVATPKGLVHGHDGTGGFLHVSKTGIVGSTVVMIPDGTGDVTKAVRIMGVASNSTPTTFDVNVYIANGANSDITDGGGNTLRFAVAANGQLSVIRQAGALTWSCSVWCAWQ